MTFEVKEDIKIDQRFYKVEEIRMLTEDTFVISFPKSRFKFKAGQHLAVAVRNVFQKREYSIYSEENSEKLEILVKEVLEGHLTPKLKSLKVGDLVEVNGPFGRFRIDENKIGKSKFVFIASGTGISPFHSMIKSYPELDYQLIHGVRYGDEAYESYHYDKDRYVLCTSGDKTGNVHGRLTEYLKKSEFEEGTQFYLCGNSNMIFDALEILFAKGVTRDQIHNEVYF